MKLIDLSGQTFGELYVVGLSEVSRNGHKRYHVKCSCGIEKTVLGLHKDINMMKRHYTTDYFMHLCKLVAGTCELVDIGA